MKKDVVEFWRRNKTPIGLMVQRGRGNGLKAQQIERAALIVFEEVEDIVANLSEIKPYMNGRHLEKVILLRNQLKPNMLGWRVFIIAKHIKASQYDTELTQSKAKVKKLEKALEKKGFFSWLKSLNWEFDPWQ